MSDYIDELVAKHLPCEFPDGDLACHGDHSTCCAAHYRELGRRLARAVAERVRERARVCPGCAGVGRYFDKRRKIRDCDRCAGRGVTFGGEA